jgi:lipoyl synthase
MNGSAPTWLIQQVARAKRGLGEKMAQETAQLLAKFGLPTVCQEAQCPNRGTCFSNHTATFMILGKVCTRGCAFCAVQHGKPPASPEEEEPKWLALAIAEMGIRHAVITSVTRDDLPDGGASQYVRILRTLRYHSPETTIELLIPDFGGSYEALVQVAQEGPDILAHNLDTVQRVHRKIKPRSDYSRSLEVLKGIKDMNPDIVTKSGVMLGLGERPHEVKEVLRALKEVGCDMLTLGQYFAPSLKHAAVVRYIELEEFLTWRGFALDLGFRSVAAGPLVRSSYDASTFFKELS